MYSFIWIFYSTLTLTDNVLMVSVEVLTFEPKILFYC